MVEAGILAEGFVLRGGFHQGKELNVVSTAKDQKSCTVTTLPPKRPRAPPSSREEGKKSRKTLVPQPLFNHIQPFAAPA